MDLPDLDLLQPPEITVYLDAEGKVPLALRPLTLGQLPLFARHAAPIAGLLGVLGEKTTPAVLLRMLAEGGADLISALAVASGIPVERLRTLPPDAAVRLLGGVIQANADFFTQRVLPGVRHTLAALGKTPGPG